MRVITFNCLLLVLLGSLAAAPANDVSGKWTAETLMAAGGSAQRVPTTFVLKVEGEKISGSVSGPDGTYEIQEGKADGDSAVFSIVVSGAKITYDGQLTAEGLDFIAKFEGRDRSDHFVAERVRE